MKISRKPRVMLLHNEEEGEGGGGGEREGGRGGGGEREEKGGEGGEEKVDDESEKASGSNAQSTSLRDGNLHGSGMSHSTKASPKPSFRAP